MSHAKPKGGNFKTKVGAFTSMIALGDASHKFRLHKSKSTRLQTHALLHLIGNLSPSLLRRQAAECARWPGHSIGIAPDPANVKGHQR